ncbi:hypothetical protein [Paraburkholderia sp.]|uniref:hypothetical protein n=1 Tax=Paraburkholderia sp. TaxID=1926495 RepID=UPI0039E4E609
MKKSEKNRTPRLADYFRVLAPFFTARRAFLRAKSRKTFRVSSTRDSCITTRRHPHFRSPLQSQAVEAACQRI